MSNIVSVERSDDALVRAKPVYKMLTVSPYKYWGVLFEDMMNHECIMALKELECLILEYTGFARVDSEIENSNRFHIHIVMNCDPSKILRSDHDIKRYTHKLCGKPHIRSDVCCDIRTDQNASGFLKYIAKTR